MARQTSPVPAKVRGAVAAGIPEAPFHQPVTLYRAPSGKLLHSDPDCSKTRSPRFYFVTVEVDITTVEHLLCGCTIEIPAGPVADYLTHARTVLDAPARIDGLTARFAARSATIADTIDLERLTRSLQATFAAADPALAGHCETVADQLDGLLALDEVRRLRAELRPLVARECVRDLLRAGGSVTTKPTSTYRSVHKPNVYDRTAPPYEPTAVGCFGRQPRSGLSVDGMRVLDATWAAWTAARSGRLEPDGTEIAAALSAGRDAAVLAATTDPGERFRAWMAVRAAPW